jgi:hypothetical protein
MSPTGNLHWPTGKALELLHGPDRCPTCGGREWVAVEDPLYPEALIDVRCPECTRKAKDDR